MIIRTTYVLCEEVLKLLLDAQEKTKWSVEALLLMVMRKMMKSHEQYYRDEGRIEYQKRKDENDMPIKKYRVKMKFLMRDYNYFQDMRRIFRRSISLNMAIAVYSYLVEIVEKILKNDITAIKADNYPYECYAIIGKCIENITTYRVWWGVPPNLELLITK